MILQSLISTLRTNGPADVKRDVMKLLSDLKNVYIHTDLRKISFEILADASLGVSVPERALNYLFLGGNLEEVWFPAFNYDFSKSGIFNSSKDSVAVGSINSYVASRSDSLRTLCPIFSNVGYGNCLEQEFLEVYKPFGKGSDFEKLLNAETSILFYGADISAFTFIHYLEEYVYVPYRYQKKISGIVTDGIIENYSSVEFLARPRNGGVEYDWYKLQQDLKAHEIVRANTSGDFLGFSLNMADSATFILDKLRYDPFYLLTSNSKDLVMSKIDSLGRPYLISDFEE